MMISYKGFAHPLWWIQGVVYDLGPYPEPNASVWLVPGTGDPS